MGVVAYSLLLFATLSLVSSDCRGIVENMNVLFSSGTDEALNTFWTSFDLTCTETDKQAVKTRIEKCNTPEGTSKACDLIYNKATSDCAVFKVKDVNIDCDPILYAILAGTAKDGAKFSKLMEQIAMQVCIGPDRTICDEADMLCVKWPEHSKACDSVGTASRFLRVVKSTQRNIKDMRLLVNGKYSKFAESFLKNAWVPDDSIKWKSTDCETLKNDLICKVINEKCKAKDGNFQKICESKEQKPKPTTAAPEKPVTKEKEESYTSIIITACCILLLIAMSVGCFVFQIIKKKRKAKKVEELKRRIKGNIARNKEDAAAELKETPAATPEKSTTPNSQSTEGAEKKEDGPPKDGKPRNAPTQGGGSQMNQAPPQPAGEKKPQSQSKPPSLS